MDPNPGWKISDPGWKNSDWGWKNSDSGWKHSYRGWKILIRYPDKHPGSATNTAPVHQ